VLEGSKPMLTEPQGPQISRFPKPHKSPLLKSLVIFIAFLFLGIFLCFIAEALENLRKDPEVKAKFRAALGRETEGKE
jgi:hypothetical protein